MAASNGTQTNPAENLDIQGIIATIDRWLEEDLPKAELSVTQPTPADNNNNSANDSNHSSHLANGNCSSNNNNNANSGSSNDNSGSNGTPSNNNKEVNDDKKGKNGSEQVSCSGIRALLKNEKTSSSTAAENKVDSNVEAKDNVNRRGDSSSHQSQLEKVRKKLNQVKGSLNELKKLEEGELGKRIQPHLRLIGDILASETASAGPTEAKFRFIVKEIVKIQNQIPSLHKLSSTSSGSYNQSLTDNLSKARSVVHGLLNPHNSTIFRNSRFFKEIEEIFKDLNEEKKFFLSCFGVLAENEAVKRRLLTYWWVGEGILEASGTGADAPEKVVDGILGEFKEKGLIEPSDIKRKRLVKSYRMHPLVRSAVIVLSQKKFFDYDSQGNPTANLSESYRACLARAEEASSEQVLEKTSNSIQENLEKLVTLFNVNDPFPDLELQLLSKRKNLTVVEWLSKMRKVRVLYLGRWQKSDKYHIEVESIEFLKGLRNMKELRLLSLQGISRINELPSSIGNLKNLMILDVKACHNLEVLPKEISLLKNLRYLDVSDCYLLDHMPKGLSSLSELRVLKGFVIGIPQSGSTGTLDDLKGLTKLRKLTVSSSSEDFPAQKDLLALQQLVAHGVLRKLTIAWGSKQGNVEAKPSRILLAKQTSRIFNKQRTFRNAAGVELPKLEKLEKLDLQCFPKPEKPSWLTPDCLPGLKKLYVRGGRLETLGDGQWKTETLCLKFLTEFHMSWRELRSKFPKLVYLEKVECPRITLCPCDGNGVWVRP